MRIRKPMTWPPRVGQRIHFDSGWEHNSWSAEVRAVVDDDVAVIKRWRKRKGWFVYEILERLTVEAFNEKDTKRYFEGPMPLARLLELQRIGS